MSTEMNETPDFDDAFRRWAARPPLTSAADAARAAMARVSESGNAGQRRVPLSPAWATLTVAILLLVAGTASFIRSLPRVSPMPASDNTAEPSAVPAREADVVLWLDDGTPVYVFLPGGD